MRTVAAILTLCIALLGAVPAGAQGTLKPVVWLDDTQLGTLAVLRSGGKDPLVALGPLAHALDWKIVRTSGTAVLNGHDRSLILTIGLRTVGEDGDPHAMFAEPPIDRGGQIYLSAHDAAKLFGLSLSTNGRLVFHRPQDISTNTEISEIPASPTPHPTATPRVNRSNENGGDGATANAGRVLLSLDRTGSANVLNIQSETQGSFLATRLDSSGVNQVGPPDAAVIVGDAKRNASIGYISDPLAGLIFGGGVYEGVDVHNGIAGNDEFIGRRLDDGYSSFGAALSNPQDGTSNTLDVLMHGSSYAEMLLRRFAVWHEPWGDYSREFIIGDRGFGMGFGARTRGRTFVETAVTYASRGLPLGPNDAPIRVDLGRQLSDATTVVAGFEETPLTPFGPFVGISTHAQNLVAGISATNHEVSGSLAYHTANADIQGYTVPGVSRATGLEGTYYFPAVTIDAQSIDELGDNESFIEAHTNRPGLNLVTGVGFPSGGKAGPIGGVSIPVTHMLSIEGTLRPSASGPYRYCGFDRPAPRCVPADGPRERSPRRCRDARGTRLRRRRTGGDAQHLGVYGSGYQRHAHVLGGEHRRKRRFARSVRQCRSRRRYGRAGTLSRANRKRPPHARSDGDRSDRLLARGDHRVDRARRHRRTNECGRHVFLPAATDSTRCNGRNRSRIAAARASPGARAVAQRRRRARDPPRPVGRTANVPVTLIYCCCCCCS